jgi:hypothetical protein
MSNRSLKSKRGSKAFSLASGATKSIDEATTNIPSTTSQSREIFLGEEEISDVSLATRLRFNRRAYGCGCCGGSCGISKVNR